MTDYTKSLAFFSLVFLFIHCRPKAKNKTLDAAISAVIALAISSDLVNGVFYQYMGTGGIVVVLAVSVFFLCIVSQIIKELEEVFVS